MIQCVKIYIYKCSYYSWFFSLYDCFLPLVSKVSSSPTAQYKYSLTPNGSSSERCVSTDQGGFPHSQALGGHSNIFRCKSTRSISQELVTPRARPQKISRGVSSGISQYTQHKASKPNFYKRKNAREMDENIPLPCKKKECELRKGSKRKSNKEIEQNKSMQEKWQL